MVRESKSKKELAMERIENGLDIYMTYSDLVRLHIPDATDARSNYILWEHTSFPLGSIKQINRQLIDYANKNEEE